MQVKRVIEQTKSFPKLGAKIKQAREQDLRSVTAIAREVGISRQYWYQLEREDLRSAVTEQLLRKIEDVLGVDLGVKF